MRPIKITALLVLFVFALSIPAFAGGKVRALNIFPYILDTVSVPLYPENIEELCKTEPNDDGLCIENELIPSEQTGTYEYIETTVVGTVTAYRRGCSDNWEIPTNGEQIPIRCRKYPWKNENHYCETKTFSDGIQSETKVGTYTYTDHFPGGVSYQQNSASIQCPEIEDIPVQEVEYKKLVTSAKVGDTINVEATGYAWSEHKVKYRIVVRYFRPGKSHFNVVLRTDREKEIANGFFYDEIEGGFTFDKPGTYSFIFFIWKPDGTRGSSRSRSVMVTEDISEPTIQ